MEDITPGLIEAVKKDFEKNLADSKNIERLTAMIRDGTATYTDGNDYALEVGNALAKAFKANISSDVLPDGKMYYNIAERLLKDRLGASHDLIAEYMRTVQTLLNQAYGIGINAIIPELDNDNLQSIVNMLSAADNYDDVANVLEEPVIQFCQNITNRTAQKNSDFQFKSGFSPVIIRQYEGKHRERKKLKDCVWCKSLAGTYNYSDVKGAGNDVFKRHDGCRCKLMYVPDKGIAEQMLPSGHAFVASGKKSYGERSSKTRKDYMSKKQIRMRERNDFVADMVAKGWSAKSASIYFNTHLEFLSSVTY